MHIVITLGSLISIKVILVHQNAPTELSDVHNIFHVSQLRKCLQVPDKPDLYKDVDHQAIDLQPNLTYRERPIYILDEAERRTRSHTIKYFKVQWSNHTQAEAT